MRILKSIIISLAMVACLVVIPTAAMADSITFGASDDGKGQPVGVHLQSQGRVNFDWVAVTGPASLTNEYWGANDIHIFDALGLTSVSAGNTYTVSNNYGVSMWLSPSNSTNILSQDLGSSFTGWDFKATLNLTSISFSSDGNTITINGFLNSMYNNLTSNTVLSDLAGTSSPGFVLSITSNSRTTDLIAALNSGNLSSWADIDGALGVSINQSQVPEPGSMLLFGSAAGALGWWRRRQKKAQRASA